jgi:hypothetical protein
VGNVDLCLELEAQARATQNYFGFESLSLRIEL